MSNFIYIHIASNGEDEAQESRLIKVTRNFKENVRSNRFTFPPFFSRTRGYRDSFRGNGTILRSSRRVCAAQQRGRVRTSHMRGEGTRARTSCVRAASDLRKRLDRSSTRRASPRRSAAAPLFACLATHVTASRHTRSNAS